MLRSVSGYKTEDTILTDNLQLPTTTVVLSSAILHISYLNTYDYFGLDFSFNRKFLVTFLFLFIVGLCWTQRLHLIFSL